MENVLKDSFLCVDSFDVIYILAELASRLRRESPIYVCKECEPLGVHCGLVMIRLQCYAHTLGPGRDGAHGP